MLEFLALEIGELSPIAVLVFCIIIIAANYSRRAGFATIIIVLFFIVIQILARDPAWLQWHRGIFWLAFICALWVDFESYKKSWKKRAENLLEFIISIKSSIVSMKLENFFQEKKALLESLEGFPEVFGEEPLDEAGAERVKELIAEYRMKEKEINERGENKFRRKSDLEEIKSKLESKYGIDGSFFSTHCDF